MTGKGEAPVDVNPPDDPFVGTLVDWGRTARRIRRSALVVGTAVVLGWLVVGVATGGPSLRDLGAALFVGLVAMIGVEFVVVGGSAVRGMLAAGERGERLAAGDVTLVPPQLRRKR
jgi:hypothetical protein